MKNITHFKVGDLVSMPSTEFLKLAKLGLILKMPVYGRTVELSKAYNDYIVSESDGRTYTLKPATSEFLKDLNCGIKFEVVRHVGGVILKKEANMKVIQVGETLLNVNNISNISIVPHPSGTNGYVVRIIMSNNNCYYEKAADGTNTNLIDFFKNKIVTIGEDNEV